MQKEIDARVTESTLIETIAHINAGIHTDPTIIKQLKTKQDPELDPDDKIKVNASALSKKLNQTWEGLTLLMNSIKKTDTKLAVAQKELG